MSNHIIALDKDVIHGLCSGQVVVTLASAVKELLENSVDAGATKVEIRLKQLGSESIEVIDNGAGIEESQFSSLTGQHCTSKLREFDDLKSVETFGFRGEALSALCHLSHLIIHTRSTNAAVGSRLEFDTLGKLVSRRPLSRAFGTTVTVSNLFHNLPVRRRYLTDQSRLSKEFGKAVTLLTAYCLASVSVQISCYRVGKNAEKTLVVGNGTALSLRENVSSVFGHSQLGTLMELVQVDEIPPDILEEFNCKASPGLRLTGFVSRALNSSTFNAASPVRSSGRSSSDRQFVFINGRPCDLPRVTRLATDIWRRSGREAQSGVNAGVRVPLPSISTSPTISSGLHGTPAGGQFPVLVLLFDLPTSAVDVNVTPDKRTLLLHHENYVLALTKAALLRTFGNGTDGLHLMSLAADFGASTGSQEATPTSERKRPRYDAFVGKSGGGRISLPSASTDGFSSSGNTASFPADVKVSNNTCEPSPSSSVPCLSSQLPTIEDLTGTKSGLLDLENLHCKSFVTTFSAEDATGSSGPTDQASIATDPSVTPKLFSDHFRADAADLPDSQLTAYFSKANFNAMQVIGQFNLGFIIARHGLDLFIIDQHASDEKYRFEKLCETHHFACQPLVTPQDLQLTVEQEQLLVNNLDIFQRNGFLFQTNEEAPCGRQVHLTATPMLEGKVFGKPDIEEMLSALAECYSRTCRPSRLRDILASRSCRSAIMIGTALDHSKMKRIIHNMGTMEHPWNCPHGRPTMRHLVNLGQLGTD